MKYLFVAFITIILASYCVRAQGPTEIVPEFNFYKPDKTVFTKKDLAKGKYLFFIFFDSECDHCQQAMQYLNQHYDEFRKAAIYLISLDSWEKITAFMNTYGSKLKGKENVTVLQDQKYEFINKFKPRKYPSMFLYSKERKLIEYEDNPGTMFRFPQEINEH